MWGVTIIIIGVIALGVYGGVYVMHASLGIEVPTDSFVTQVMNAILIIGIILLVVGGAVTAIQLRKN